MARLEAGRITWLEAVLWMAAIVTPLLLLARIPGTEEVARIWIAAVNRHDTAAAQALTRTDFRIRFPDGAVHAGPERVAEALAWREAIGARIQIVKFVRIHDEDRVSTFVVEEDSEVHRLLGTRPRLLAHYGVYGGELYKEDLRPLDPRDPAMRRALAPFLTWARETDPERLDRIWRKGRMIRSEETAREWLEMLRAWRAARE